MHDHLRLELEQHYPKSSSNQDWERVAKTISTHAKNSPFKLGDDAAEDDHQESDFFYYVPNQNHHHNPHSLAAEKTQSLIVTSTLIVDVFSLATCCFNEVTQRTAGLNLISDSHTDLHTILLRHRLAHHEHANTEQCAGEPGVAASQELPQGVELLERWTLSMITNST